VGAPDSRGREPGLVAGAPLQGAYDYNASKKGRLYPAKTVGDALENVPAKFFREAELWVKTKTPVIVLRTDNEIPRG
jgi:hypothetical protein